MNEFAKEQKTKKSNLNEKLRPYTLNGVFRQTLIIKSEMASDFY
jgi:hypothetical protein